MKGDDFIFVFIFLLEFLLYCIAKHCPLFYTLPPCADFSGMLEIGESFRPEQVLLVQQQLLVLAPLFILFNPVEENLLCSIK